MGKFVIAVQDTDDVSLLMQHAVPIPLNTCASLGLLTQGGGGSLGQLPEFFTVVL